MSRDEVLMAAIDLADRDGLAAISMRKVADQVAVVPMALYKHVSDKDDLVAGMIDAVVAEYAEPALGATWQSRVRHRALSARDGLLRHPWLRSALETATIRTPTVLGYMDAVAGDLLAGGLSVDLVHYAMHALGYRIWGFTPEAFAEQSSADDAVMSPEVAAAMAQRFPNIASIAQDAARRNPGGACDEGEEFVFGLNLLLDAIDRLREAGWQSGQMS